MGHGKWGVLARSCVESVEGTGGLVGVFEPLNKNGAPLGARGMPTKMPRPRFSSGGTKAHYTRDFTEPQTPTPFPDTRQKKTPLQKKASILKKKLREERKMAEGVKKLIRVNIRPAPRPRVF
jgi:hypothetical protein